MNADRLREILRIEYGIRSDEELYEAVSNMKPLDIGLFTTPINRTKPKGACNEK